MSHLHWHRGITVFNDEFKSDTRAKLNRGSVYEMEFKPIQFMLTPKNRYVFDYRRAAIIDREGRAKLDRCISEEVAL